MKGGSPGVVVMGGDSCQTKGREFESMALYTGWTFLTFIFCKNYNVFLKRQK